MIRFLDIVFSFIGIVFFLPFFLIIAICIKLDSKGPIFYKQLRVGKNSIDFEIYKFRSMKVGSEKKSLLTIGNEDSRITKSGFFLRKYKIDELPQLFNVFKGDMSFVGPRPEVRKYVEMYNEEQLKVLKVRPGITDYASILYSKENEVLSKYKDPEKYYIEKLLPSKIKLNLKFINDYSLKEYFKIIFLTIKKVFQS